MVAKTGSTGNQFFTHLFVFFFQLLNIIQLLREELSVQRQEVAAARAETAAVRKEAAGERLKHDQKMKEATVRLDLKEKYKLNATFPFIRQRIELAEAMYWSPFDKVPAEVPASYQPWFDADLGEYVNQVEKNIT